MIGIAPGPDIIAYSETGEPVLIAEVKSRPGDAGPMLAQISSYADHIASAVPFAMVVDPQRIRVYRMADAADLVPVFDMSTESILSSYDPAFAGKRVLEAYLSALVTAWLKDVSLRWRGETVPGLVALSAVGLDFLLANGTVAPIGVDGSGYGYGDGAYGFGAPDGSGCGGGDFR
jgi:hypothetical protein